MKVILAIVTLCSIATFYGVWQILNIHNRAIKVGAKTDIDFIHIVEDMDKTNQNCQDRLKIIELENKIVKEQIDTLFEFHEKDKVKAKVIYTE